MIQREFSAILQDYGLIFVPANSLAEALKYPDVQGLVIACTELNAYSLLRMGVIFTEPIDLYFFLTQLIYTEFIIAHYQLTSNSLSTFVVMDIDENLQAYYVDDEDTDEKIYFLPFTLEYDN